MKLHLCQAAIFLFMSFPLYAQPSFTIMVDFKFYDGQAQVEKKMFDKDYKLVNDTWKRNDSMQYRYDEAQKAYSIQGGVIYNNLKVLIIKGKDSMQLIFMTNGGVRQKFEIEKLSFKEGSFIINNEHTAFLDLKNSRSNYYNYLLANLPENHQNKSNETLAEINKLKLKYCIAQDDLKVKKESELVEISTLKDNAIIKRYIELLMLDNFGATGEAAGNNRFTREKTIYSPDKKFKIFVLKGESCAGNCTTFYESFIHFNLDKKNPTVLTASFFPVDSILVINKNKYLIFQSGYDGSGIYIYNHKIITLLSLEKNSIQVGNNFNFQFNKGTKDEKGFDIEERQLYATGTDENFYLRFDPANNLLSYRFWRFINEETGKKKFYFGKLIFKEDHFKWILSTE